MLNAIETRTPPTIGYLATLPEQAARIATRIALEVAEIDRALEVLDDLLNLLQPPRSGKIRIEWWERAGRPVPQPVVWSHAKATGWRAKRVPSAGLSRRARSTHDFHDTCQQVRAVCQNVTKLMTMREQALAPLAMFSRSTAGTLHTNERVLTMTCLGIDLAAGMARQALGIADADTEPCDGDELAIE
jgi:hypothetical protein